MLAISRNGAGVGNYNIVTVRGAWGGNVALTQDNGVTGALRALMVDDGSQLGARLPVGDVITVLATLTAFSDPASFDSILSNNDLLNLTGPLSGLDLVGSTTVTPEPSTFLLLGGGLIAFRIARDSQTVSSSCVAGSGSRSSYRWSLSRFFSCFIWCSIL